MPYVPKNDRPALDEAAKAAAVDMARTLQSGKNFSVVYAFRVFFEAISTDLVVREKNRGRDVHFKKNALAEAIFAAGEKHNYEGAFLGELNYAITRFLQHLPRAMIESGKWKDTDEFRYWLYACMGEALIMASDHAKQFGMGIGGVFEDIKDEYKWRVNRPYETAQILKSGDCYDAPHYNRLVRVVDSEGSLVGHIYIDLVRPAEYRDNPSNIHPDVLGNTLVLSTEDGKS